MAKIHISEPEGPYSCVVDTEAMNVTLKEVYLGVCFETVDGAKLSVCMRDDGFEVHYYKDDEFDRGWVEFKGGLLPGEVRSQE